MNTIKSDVKSVPADYSLLVATNFLICLFSIVITSMLTRMMDAASYGVYSVFIFATQTLLLFSSTWIISSIVRFGREEFDKTAKVSRIFWAYALVVCVMFGLSSLVVVALREGVSKYIGITKQEIWILLTYVFLLLISTSLLSIYQATRKLKIYGILQVLEKFVLLLILSFLYVYYHRLSVQLLLYSFLISSGIFVSINIIITKKDILIPVKFRKNDLKELLIFSGPLFISVGTAHFGMWISPILINNFLTKDQLGTYYLAHQINFLVGSTILQLSIALTPILVLLYSRKKIDLIDLYVRKLVPLGVFVWAIIVALTMVVSKLLFLHLFGKNFVFALNPLQVLLLGTGFAGIHVLFAGVLTAYKFTWASTKASLIYIFTNLLGNIILIKFFGILGAAIATCIASIAYSISIMLETHKVTKFKFSLIVFNVIPVFFSFLIVFCIKGVIATIVISFIMFIGLVIVIKRFFLDKDLVTVLSKLEFPGWTIDFIRRRLAN
ncbi:MAG: polysaccharide biosynthesis C-terminal domain-containing protein [Candidatus Omnitrophica bacterium]|nr:polysaccharide biosynthesis C-terminal domain-containing protein [Candidatus Omnitrophota bacterium]